MAKYIAPSTNNAEQIGDATHIYGNAYIRTFHIGSGAAIGIKNSSGTEIITINDSV